MADYWKDKVVWITGASSGIGEGLAKQLADRGAHLILSSRNADKLEALKAKLAKTENHTILPLDVSNEQSINQAVNTNKELVDTVDVLINNAGVSQRALTWEASRESERLIMETNFYGATALTKAVLPGMMKRNAGSIISLSSPAGAFGFPLRSSYSASKHALHGYFDSLRAELDAAKKNIHIMLVLPGRVSTNMSFNALTQDGSKQAEADQRLASGLSAEECAKGIIKAAEKRKAEIYFGREQILIYIKRYLPGVFRSIVTKFKPD
jgi:dehydrogenase/reductase SDR family protein 7B